LGARIVSVEQEPEFLLKICRDFRIPVNNALLIDDDKSIGQAFEKLGGKCIVHEGINDLALKLQSFVNGGK
jgi:hypothetical protein